MNKNNLPYHYLVTTDQDFIALVDLGEETRTETILAMMENDNGAIADGLRAGFPELSHALQLYRKARTPLPVGVYVEAVAALVAGFPVIISDER